MRPNRVKTRVRQGSTSGTLRGASGGATSRGGRDQLRLRRNNAMFGSSALIGSSPLLGSSVLAYVASAYCLLFWLKVKVQGPSPTKAVRVIISLIPRIWCLVCHTRYQVLNSSRAAGRFFFQPCIDEDSERVGCQYRNHVRTYNTYRYTKFDQLPSHGNMTLRRSNVLAHSSTSIKTSTSTAVPVPV